MENHEVEHEFPHLGTRIMCLNARQVFYKEGAETTILLGIEDVTTRRTLEREKEDLLRQKDVLLEEIQHRIANSLQIIARIILMKANSVNSEETRILLRDTHDRVISIAAVQEQLNASGMVGSCARGSSAGSNTGHCSDTCEHASSLRPTSLFSDRTLIVTSGC